MRSSADLVSALRNLKSEEATFNFDAWKLEKLSQTGTSKIQPDLALRNLFEVSQAFKRNGLTPWVVNGTLLGIVREGGLIRHDTDTDIAVRSTNPEAIRRTINDLVGKGFRVVRVARGFDLVTVLRDFEYVDISIYSLRRVFLRRYLQSTFWSLDPYRYVKKFLPITVQGYELNIPYRSAELLGFWYGERWMEPLENTPRTCHVPLRRIDDMIRRLPKRVLDSLYLSWHRIRKSGAKPGETTVHRI